MPEPAADSPKKLSKYAPEISAAAIRQIIMDAMAEKNIKQKDIPEGVFISPRKTQNSKRYLEVKGFAWFSCPKQHHRWPSAQSWCFVDLKKQSIRYRDRQKCKKCNSEAAPEFSADSIEKMAEFVVRKYLIKTGKLRPVYHPHSAEWEETQGGPHDEGRCGKCRRLGRSCWK